MRYVDFALTHADDQYLDTLSSAEPGEWQDDLSALLLAWRSAVDAEPITELVGWAEAVTVVVKSRRRRRRRCA